MTKKNQSPGDQIAQDIIEKYQPKTVEDMQDALKEIFGPMFQAGSTPEFWSLVPIYPTSVA